MPETVMETGLPQGTTRETDDGPEATRSELLTAAVELFAERGYRRTTLDDVAAAAGYTKGAIYWHFTSKEDLGVAVFDAWTREGMGNLRQALRTADTRDRARALEAWHLGDPDRSRRWTVFELDLLQLAAREPSLAERLRERQREVCALFAEAIAEEFAATADALVTPEELAVLLAALSDGLLQHELLDPGSVRGLFGRVAARLLPVSELP